MHSLSRRTFLALPVGLAAIDTLRAAVKPVHITDIDLFTVDVPVTPAEEAAGVQHRYAVVKLVTDAGVTGYSFAGPYPRSLPPFRKEAFVGEDLFNVEGQLRKGLWRWGGIEHAVWDAIGKIAGQPVFKLLGGHEDRVNAYLTCVWPGPADQQQVPFKDQVDMAVRIKNAGFKGMKIRVWRPNPMDDVEVCRLIKEATGPDFHLMFDRTADAPVSMSGQLVWDFETGLKVARALQKAGAYWLEEPFARPDYETPAKLASMVDILITGGEGYDSLESVPPMSASQDLRHSATRRQPRRRDLPLSSGRHSGRGLPRPGDPARHDEPDAGRVAPGDPRDRRSVAGNGSDHPASAARGTMGSGAEASQEQTGVQH